jgi:hypothetical protein
VPGGQARQLIESRGQFGPETIALGKFEARVQSRQLDGDPRALVDGITRRAFADSADRVSVGLEVGVRVPRRECGLPEHVVGVAEAAPGLLRAPLQGLLDGLAEDELVAHLAHGATYGNTDHGFAETLDRAVEQPGDARRVVVVEHATGHHQADGRCVDQGGTGFSRMCSLQS